MKDSKDEIDNDGTKDDSDSDGDGNGKGDDDEELLVREARYKLEILSCNMVLIQLLYIAARKSSLLHFSGPTKDRIFYEGPRFESETCDMGLSASGWAYLLIHF